MEDRTGTLDLLARLRRFAAAAVVGCRKHSPSTVADQRSEAVSAIGLSVPCSQSRCIATWANNISALFQSATTGVTTVVPRVLDSPWRRGHLMSILRQWAAERDD